MKVRLWINAVDVTSSLFEQWYLDDNDGDLIDTLEVSLDDPTLATAIDIEGTDIILEDFDDNTNRLFGGLVTEIVVRPYGVGRQIDITAQDWKVVLDRSAFSKIYKAEDDNDIIDDAFSEASVVDFDTTTYVEFSRAIAYLKFEGQTLRQMLEAVSKITGLQWNVDAFKNVIYRVPGREEAPYALSSDPDNVLTFPFYDASRVGDLGAYNEVEVRGSNILSSDVTDVYAGDGATTVFTLTGGGDLHAIRREPSTVSRVIIARNTGADGAPVWTDTVVGLEGQDTLGVAGITCLWNAASMRVEFSVAPNNFANNGWRITGRYYMQVGYIASEVGPTPRTLRKVIVEPTLDDNLLAEDIAAAFLRESRNRKKIMCNVDRDGLSVGQIIWLYSPVLGYSSVKQFEIHAIRTRVLGAQVYSYGLVIGQSSHTFADLMRELRDKAGAQSVESDTPFTVMRKVTKKIAIKSITVRSERTGPNYYCRDLDNPNDRYNQCPNPGFEVSLAGYTEGIDAPVTATTDRVLTQSNSGLYSLEIDVTAIIGIGGYARRYIIIPASPGDVWSFGCQGKMTAKTANGHGTFIVHWLDAGLVGIGGAAGFTNITTIADWAEQKIENVTAPALTVWAIIYLTAGQAAGDKATVYYDDIIFEKASSLGDYFDGFINDGHWQGTEGLSTSCKGDSEAAYCGFAICRT